MLKNARQTAVVDCHKLFIGGAGEKLRPENPHARHGKNRPAKRQHHRRRNPGKIRWSELILLCQRRLMTR